MLARVHFIVRTDPNNPPGDIDADLLAEELADATRLWDDDYRLVLERKLGDEQAKHLFARYADAFPEGYKDGHTPYEAMKDLAKLELLEEPGQLEMHLFRKQRRRVRTRPRRRRRRGDGRAVQGLPVRRADDALRRAAGAALARREGGRRAPVRGASASTAGSGSTTSVWSCPSGTRTWPRCARTWRTPSPPPGGARPRWTASTSWCCGPGSPGGRSSCCARTRSTCARPAPCSPRSTWSRRSSRTRRSPQLLVQLFETRFAPGAHHARASAGSAAASWSTRSARRWTRWPASTRTASCASYLTLIQATLRTSFFQKRGGRAAQVVRGVQAGPAGHPGPAGAAAEVRDLRLLAPVRGRAPALRAGGPRRPALVRPARGLPHRGARPGQGADGEERGDRAGRRQGRLRAQAEAGRPGRGGRPATRCSSPRCSTSPTTSSAARSCRPRTWSGTTATTRTWWWPPTRAPRRSPTSPTRSPRRTASGSATRSPPAARPATTTRRWASPPGAPGSRSSGTSASWAHDTQTQDFTVVGVGDMSGDVFGNGMLLSRAHPAGGRVRPPAHLPRPGPGLGPRRSRSASGCSTCPARRGTTTTAS